MLCTFTLPGGATLVIRSEDIKEIRDVAGDATTLAYIVGTDVRTATVVGSATANLLRLQREELETMTRVEQHQREMQQRLQAGFPAPRGRGRP